MLKFVISPLALWNKRAEHRQFSCANYSTGRGSVFSVKLKALPPGHVALAPWNDTASHRRCSAANYSTGRG